MISLINSFCDILLKKLTSDKNAQLFDINGTLFGDAGCQTTK